MTDKMFIATWLSSVEVVAPVCNHMHWSSVITDDQAEMWMENILINNNLDIISNEIMPVVIKEYEKLLDDNKVLPQFAAMLKRSEVHMYAQLIKNIAIIGG